MLTKEEEAKLASIKESLEREIAGKEEFYLNLEMMLWMATELEKAHEEVSTIVKKAKDRLMTDLGATEPFAHKFMQQTAMSGRMRLVDVAINVLTADTLV